MKSIANIQEETGAILGAAVAEITTRAIVPVLNPLIEKTDALAEGVGSQSGELGRLTRELASLRRDSMAALTEIRAKEDENAKSIMELRLLVERLQQEMGGRFERETQIVREAETRLRAEIQDLGASTIRLEKFGLTTELLQRLAIANLVLSGVLMAMLGFGLLHR
jgi:hypothetical protein